MSQFSDIFEAVKDNRPKAENVNKQEKKTLKGKAQSVRTLPTVTEEQINQPATNEKRTGKSSNPSYTQVLTYIKRDTHKEVKKVLFEESGRVDLSTLVEELLAKWLQKRK